MGGIDDKKISVVLKFDNCWLDYWTCITAHNSSRGLEFRDGELVVSVLAMFIVVRLAGSFLYYGLAKVLRGWLFICCCPVSFWIAKRRLARKMM